MLKDLPKQAAKQAPAKINLICSLLKIQHGRSLRF